MKQQVALTTEVLAHFKGGQLEIQNEREDYIYRGEVANVVVKDGWIKVQFAWIAKGKDGIPPVSWVNEYVLSYKADTISYYGSDLGDGRISMHSPWFSETATFFPPGGSKLDPAKVEGLKIPA
jgi:hypothetical protein